MEQLKIYIFYLHNCLSVNLIINLCFRTTVIKCLPSREGDDWSPDEVQGELCPQNPPRTTSSVGLSSYTVLPPIGDPQREVHELSPCQSVNAANPTERSCSDGYLVQMEKQKQLRARVTYKVGLSLSIMFVLNGWGSMYMTYIHCI